MKMQNGAVVSKNLFFDPREIERGEIRVKGNRASDGEVIK